MSDLDKVIYIADTIEPLRDFKGVDALREAAGNMSLHDLFALCYTQSLLGLIESKRFIHPATVAVWNAQVAGGVR
jgi:HD superfamily phosphohydrolase YqeK